MEISGLLVGPGANLANCDLSGCLLGKPDQVGTYKGGYGLRA
jgi:hypothetical protein